MKNPMLRRAANAALIFSTCWVMACTQPSTEAKLAAVTSPTLAAGSDAALATQSTKIATLLASGDYAAAIAAINASAAPEADRLSASGRLILDGLIDPAAKNKLGFSVDDGLSRLERAAVLGNEPSVSDLVGFFTLGLNYRGEKVVFSPSPELASCWQAVGKSTKRANDCVALRKTLGAPK